MSLKLRIKQIILPSGNTYYVYDADTRAMITSKNYTPGVAYSVGDLVVYEDALYKVTAAIDATDNTTWTDVTTTSTTIETEIKNIKSTVTGVMYYRGVTTTSLTDGSTTATIVINGESVTFTADDAGSVVISGTGSSQKEYVWSGTTWNEFGSTGALKALAFKDNASGSYDKTTSASVTVPTISSTTKYLGTISIPNVTAAGSASTWAFTVTNEVLSISGTNSTAPTLGTSITAATGSLIDNSGQGDALVGSLTTGTDTATVSLNHTSTSITVQ